jgi:DNA-binding phage protein
MADLIESTLVKKTKLSDLQTAKEEATQIETVLTEKIINAVITDLKDIKGNNGYTAIAQKNKVSREQVMEIHTKMLARIAELTPAPTPVVATLK